MPVFFNTTSTCVNVIGAEAWCNTTAVSTCQTITMITTGTTSTTEWCGWPTMRQLEAQLEEARLRREAAEAVAKRLLVECLSAAQRDEFKARGMITVRGRCHRYRIRKGRTGNVDVIGRDGRLMHNLCCHPIGDMPDYDIMLAQKLMLEVCEDEFVGKANVHASGDAGRQVLEAEEA